MRMKPKKKQTRTKKDSPCKNESLDGCKIIVYYRFIPSTPAAQNLLVSSNEKCI